MLCFKLSVGIPLSAPVLRWLFPAEGTSERNPKDISSSTILAMQELLALPWKMLCPMPCKAKRGPIEGLKHAGNPCVETNPDQPLLAWPCNCVLLAVWFACMKARVWDSCCYLLFAFLLCALLCLRLALLFFEPLLCAGKGNACRLTI